MESNCHALKKKLIKCLTRSISAVLPRLIHSRYCRKDEQHISDKLPEVCNDVEI